MEKQAGERNVDSIIGSIPYRMAFAGGWMNQPFNSTHNPSLPSSIIMVSLEPTFHFMTKRAMGISTSATASACSGETCHVDLEGYSA